VSIESDFDLATDQVIGVVQPPTPSFVLDCQPLSADHNHQYVAGGDRRLDLLDEVLTWINAVYVLKDSTGTEMRD
jgi:hypothetical protein